MKRTNYDAAKFRNPPSRSRPLGEKQLNWLDENLRPGGVPLFREMREAAEANADQLIEMQLATMAQMPEVPLAWRDEA